MSRRLKRRHHVRDRIVERHVPVEVWLPESLEQFQIVIPPALIQPFAHRVWHVLAVGVAVETPSSPA